MVRREVVLDTETTGLNPEKGHRIIDIGVVELYDYFPTGRYHQWYINPECSAEKEEEAFRVHGLNDAFLETQPVFATIVEELLTFIGDSVLVMHNAKFDLSFLNAELGRLNLPLISVGQTLDTVQLALQKFPGTQVNLEALCRRFGVEVSNHHNALADARMLAECYLELRGGRQVNFDLSAANTARTDIPIRSRTVRKPRLHKPTSEEIAAHKELIVKLENPLWGKFLS